MIEQLFKELQFLSHHSINSASITFWGKLMKYAFIPYALCYYSLPGVRLPVFLIFSPWRSWHGQSLQWGEPQRQSPGRGNPAYSDGSATRCPLSIAVLYIGIHV